MYAIVEIAGHQYKVQKDQQVYVNRLQAKEGDKVSFDNVLLLDDNGNVTVGAPAIDGAQVSAKVEKHLKGDKVIVFKKKRRKGYRKKNGFRAYLTELTIDSIVAKGAKKAEKSAESKPKAEKKTEAKSESKTTAKKTEAKKAAPKKETAKKAAPSSSAKAADSSKKAEKKETAKKAAPKKSAEKSDDKKEDK
ncbi:50S ribosomal protein L21 [Halocola ammonii]